MYHLQNNFFFFKQSGKVAAELEYVNHNVRTKLDELKRTELQRLKQLVKESDRLEKMQKEGRNVNDIAGHLDHANEHTFEVADFHKLITKVTYYHYYCVFKLWLKWAAK